MKTTTTHFRRNASAFTLIELLVVIAVIGLLAAMIVPLGASIMAKAKLNRVKVEKQNLETIIQNYHDKKNFYPPDNPNNPAQPPLFYELIGTIYTPGATPPGTATFKPVVGDATPIPAATVLAMFGIGGFVNSTQNQTEDPVFSFNFGNSQHVTSGSVELLVCPVRKPDDSINPWNYVSSSPTNKPNSFDLWVDIVVRGKTNRVCNWSADPIVL
jgi:prepilin-type N-terminal cleavage/methylation domain-containing protein